MSLHASLTGADLHEPKGVAAAAANRVYVSDGAASGAWSKLPPASIDGSGATATDQFLKADGTYGERVYLSGYVADISTAGSVFVPCPIAGTIVKVITVLQGAITVADGTLRLRIGGVPVTDSDVTIAQSGSAAGDVDTAVPSAANTVTADSAIEIQGLGTSTTAARVEVLIVVDAA